MPDWMVKRRAALQKTKSASESNSDLGLTGPTANRFANADPISNPTSQKVPTPPPLRPTVSPVPSTPPVVRRKSAVRQSLAVSAVSPMATAPQPAPLSVHFILNQLLSRKSLIRGMIISLIVHILLALPLAFVVFHSDVERLGISTFLSLGSDDGNGEGLDDTNLVQIEPPGGSGPDLDTLLSSQAMSNAIGPSTLLAPDGIMGPKTPSGKEGEGEGDGDKIGDGLNVGGKGGFQMPAVGRFVRQGSFTAWTVPDDPEPGEDYKIVIQVQYKNEKQKVSSGDITGSVVGTDNFRLAISKYTAKYLTDANQVVVEIPGASARVRDTIRIYSAVLKENQRLHIVF